MTIRVVLGDDNVLVREGIRGLLSLSDDIEVVGVAEDAPSLLSAAAEHVPNVVITDIKMPPTFRLEGIECAHAIRERHPGTGVVVLSSHDDEEYALALLGRGQSGLAYLLKDRLAQGDELIHAIREVAVGGSAIDSGIAARLSGRFDPAEEDRQILDLMAAGNGYEEIAATLETTQESVDRRVTALFRRLAASAGDESAGTAVDELKKLHAAVVDSETSARTLRSFLPPQIAARLKDAASIDALRQELEVTVLFSDVRGFSTLAEEIEPGELAALVGRHLGAMAEVVFDHGGLVSEFAGDSIMGVFGAPDPMPDHAERAVRCAIAMQARQRELNAAAELEAGRSLQIGVGVNTGRVVAGPVGPPGRLEYTVVGDAVNVAQRLQSNAAGGEILVSAATLAATPGVRAEPMGELTVKGRRAPVNAHRVTASP
jgi:adenylate cyclase